jgi:hypothetical protein
MGSSELKKIKPTEGRLLPAHPVDSYDFSEHMNSA